MIKFVYFDLGGVVIRDFSGNNKWEELKRDLKMTPQQDAEFEKLWPTFEYEACLGNIRQDLISQLHFPNYSSLIDNFVNRFEENKSIWSVISEVHKKCKIGLLTNMWPNMLDAIKKRGILPNINWDIVIDSSIEQVAKPDPKIFEIAQQKANIKGQDILFVENSLGHIQAAQKFGWQIFLYDSARPEESSQKLSLLLETE